MACYDVCNLMDGRVRAQLDDPREPRSAQATKTDGGGVVTCFCGRGRVHLPA